MPKDRSTHVTRAAAAAGPAAPGPGPSGGPRGGVSGAAPGGAGSDAAHGGAKPAAPARSPVAALLLRLLPGFLPLLVYVAAESLWGETVGLAVAIAFGLLEFGFILAKERRPDWLSALDTALLVAMGGVSIAFASPIFLRVKPALLEALLAALLGFSAFGPRNLVMGRLLRDLRAAGALRPEAERRLSGLMAGMFWLVLAHAGLTAYAAFRMDEAAWLFVSGPLLYLMFGVWFVGLLAWNRLGARRGRSARRG